METQRKKAGIDLGLNDEEKALLHSFVKKTIRNRLGGNPLTDLETDSENLNQERGLTFILVTHARSVGARCGRIVRMRDGLMEDQLTGTVQER